MEASDDVTKTCQEQRQDTPSISMFWSFAISYTFHDFVYFCKLGRPLTAAKWKQWRDHCVTNDLDVDHQGQNWRRAVRAELKLEKAGINRAMNARH